MKEVYTVHQILTFSIFCDFSTFLTISSDRQKKVKSLIFGIIDGVNKVVAFSMFSFSLLFCCFRYVTIDVVNKALYKVGRPHRGWFDDIED